MTQLNDTVARVTDKIRERSHVGRQAYLNRLEEAAGRGHSRGMLSCTNLAHGLAVCSQLERERMLQQATVNIGIISAYNDMLSAHHPYKDFPDLIKQAAEEAGAIAQFAGGVPAMCDGVTQGEVGMELSLFSRDVIALATAVGLSHNLFDAVLCLGICDKIVPGLLIGCLSFPHLPVIMVPGGPMPTGESNTAKAKVRQQYAEGLIGREELLASEMRVYHAPGTCTFYGTANTNQVCMEAMGLHIPNAAFFQPYTPVREALTRAATRRATEIGMTRPEYTPIGKVVDERAIVNAIVAVLASGGSTNHTLHLVAIARAAGITITWDDFAELSEVVPLLARVYPNGPADINRFHEVGGTSFLISQLLDAGLLHGDILTVVGEGGLQRWRQVPYVSEHGKLEWRQGPEQSADEEVLRPVSRPFKPDGGIKLVTGNLGRAIMKTSAVKDEHLVVQAPAKVFDSQEDLIEAFKRGELYQDFIAVLRFQGPRANGMPELHKLTPALGVLQDRGHRVALVTDGRMSGATGKVPVALHVTPEAVGGGPIAKIREGDVILVDGKNGTLQAQVDEAEWQSREPARSDISHYHEGYGRELFSGFRKLATGAEQGGMTFSLDSLS